MKTKLLCLVALCALWASSLTAQDVWAPQDKQPPRKSAKLSGHADYSTTTQFVPYHGPQNWKTVAVADIYTEFAVPVYIGYANFQHEVIGYIYVDGQPPGRNPPKDAIKSAAAAAKAHGADALVVNPARPGSNPEWYVQAIAVKAIRKNL